MKKHQTVVFASLVLALVTAAQAQNKRDTAVRQDKEDLAQDQSWIYDDLEVALDVAAKSKRPLMIVFR